MIEKVTTWFDEYNEHGDSEKAMKALEEEQPEFDFTYHSTDAWRGYWETTAKDGSGWKWMEEGG